MKRTKLNEFEVIRIGLEIKKLNIHIKFYKS